MPDPTVQELEGHQRALVNKLTGIRGAIEVIGSMTMSYEDKRRELTLWTSWKDAVMRDLGKIEVDIIGLPQASWTDTA